MSDISLVLIDFGGVIAQEGFKKGIVDLADEFDFDTDSLKKLAFDLVYSCGFTTGKTDSDGFWDLFKKKTGIQKDNQTLTKHILKRFVVRDEMITFAKDLKKRNIKTAILSDQTNWLDELNKQYDFFKYFDKVFNSYHLGITKKEPEMFDMALKEMDDKPEKTLFIDDHSPHIQRASDKGINTILFKEVDDFRKDIKEYFNDIEF
jgi:putative hydrolase of the HAD superfamily